MYGSQSVTYVSTNIHGIVTQIGPLELSQIVQLSQTKTQEVNLNFKSFQLGTGVDWNVLKLKYLTMLQNPVSDKANVATG
jgi:hypothetical protein